MNNKELLQELSLRIKKGEISRREVTSQLSLDINTETGIPEKSEDTGSSMTKIFYVIGAAIVIAGIAIFISQIWEDLDSFGRILTTLGLGLIISFTGSVLFKISSKDYNLGPIFHLIGGAIIPGGLLVTLNEFDEVTTINTTFSFLMLFLFYLLLNRIHKHAVLTFFAIFNATAAIYAYLTLEITPVYAYYESIYNYVTMMVGITYLFLAHLFQKGWNKYLLGLLYFFGCLAILAPGFIEATDSFFWQLAFFIIIFAGLLLSVYKKSKIILAMNTIFLLIHITFITSEYFADSIGWPVALVILGFIFIGLGYMSISINKRYINKPDKI